MLPSRWICAFAPILPLTSSYIASRSHIGSRTRSRSHTLIMRWSMPPSSARNVRNSQFPRSQWRKTVWRSTFIGLSLPGTVAFLREHKKCTARYMLCLITVVVVAPVPATRTHTYTSAVWQHTAVCKNFLSQIGCSDVLRDSDRSTTKIVRHRYQVYIIKSTFAF